MENKRYLQLIGVTLFVFLLATANGAVAYRYSSSTPSSVTNFYQGMSNLSDTHDSNLANDIIGKMKKCFFNAEEGSGIDLPNDFRFFDYDRRSISHEDANQNSSNYVEKLYDYIFKDKVMTVSYTILSTEDIGSVPEFKNRKELSMSTSLMATYVEKVYRLRGEKEKTYNDTVITDYMSGKISEIRNGYGRTVININTLRNKASIAYRLGNYKEAYECYEKIVSIAPADDDALYRLGLMTYFQKGCNFSSKAARKKGLEYLNRARYAAKWTSNIYGKSRTVLKNLEYPNR